MDELLDAIWPAVTSRPINGMHLHPVQAEQYTVARAHFAAALERVIDERVAKALEGRVVQWGESSGTVRAALGEKP